MKVAILSESSADEAALRVFVEGLLGEKTVAPDRFPVRWRGVPGVFNDIKALLSLLHYRTDVDSFCVVVDSDRSPVHDPSHDAPGKAEPECRLCRLRGIVADVRRTLRPVPGRATVKTALGIAVPQIEAWYLAGRNPHVNEATWIQSLKSGVSVYRRDSLKTEVYGSGRPPLDRETECAKREAERIVRDGHLPLLEKLFPSGFGAFANDVRGWRTPG